MRGLLAVALIAGVASAVWWGLQRESAESAPVTAEPVTPPAERTDIAGYDIDVAMDLAGRLLPPGLDEYYFMEVQGAGDTRQSAAEMAELMRRASAEQDYLGVVGGNSRRTRAVFLEALEQLAPAPLDGATIIYIGIADDEPELRAAAESRGARFLFGAYANAARAVAL